MHRSVLLLLAYATTAHGEDHHHHHDDGGRVTVSIGALAATYDQYLYTGDYEGVGAGVGWSSERVGVGVGLTGYRMKRNGLVDTGIGDVMFHGHALLTRRGPWSAVAMLMASVPTGRDRAGYGMGHVMAMAELHAGWSRGPYAVTASLGFCRGIARGNAHADHGQTMWPIVAPMNLEEVGYGFDAGYAIAAAVSVAATAQGAAPTRDGDHRLVLGGRVTWTHGRTATSLELQHGTVGDPFVVRGALTATVRID